MTFRVRLTAAFRVIVGRQDSANLRLINQFSRHMSNLFSNALMRTKFTQARNTRRASPQGAVLQVALDRTYRHTT